MKLRTCLLALTVCLTACNENNPKQPALTVEEITKQPAGLIIAADSMTIAPHDFSNLPLAGVSTLYFKVKIKTTDYTHKGNYEIAADWHDKQVNTQFSMPRDAEEVVPVLTRGKEPYTYIIGFYYGKDTTFYDYYSVKGASDGIKAGYTKAYSFK